MLHRYTQLISVALFLLTTDVSSRGRHFLALLGNHLIIQFLHILIEVSEKTRLCASFRLHFQALKNLVPDGRIWLITGHFKETMIPLTVPYKACEPDSVVENPAVEVTIPALSSSACTAT